MDVIVERCAGLDVHKATVTACVRYPGLGRERAQALHTFGTTTPDLLALPPPLLVDGPLIDHCSYGMASPIPAKTRRLVVDGLDVDREAFRPEARHPSSFTIT